MKALLFVLLLVVVAASVKAQPYVEGGQTRHRFAQLTIGADTRIFLPSGSEFAALAADGQLTKKPLSPETETRLIVGGTHFWGHADFYVAIPVASFGQSGFSTGPETGARLFPWRIENRKLRPFTGFSWLVTHYQQNEGAQQTRSNFPVTTGLVYAAGNYLAELSAGYNFQNERHYYISPTQKEIIRTQPVWVAVGVKFMLETTLSAEKNWQSGHTRRLTDTLATLGKLNGFTLAAGPSSAQFLKRSAHNTHEAPYLDDHRKASIFPEFGLGYYLHQPDVQVNLAYRKNSSRLSAYGHSQKAQRRALTLEAYKFLVDYHGFALFAGGALSQEWLTVHDNPASSAATMAHYTGLKPGLVFGWDIRPDRLQAMYLRTNLRWFPNLKVAMPSHRTISFDQLEFNFIQLVVFPERLF